MIGRVYKIIHNQSNIIYVGSTTQLLRQRWAEHKYRASKEKNSIYEYFEKYGIDNFKIILIKEYDITDKNHLKVYETLWINKLKSINVLMPFQPLDKEARRQSAKKSRINNNEKIKERKKEKYKCIKCNIELNKDHKARHERSKKHLM